MVDGVNELGGLAVELREAAAAHDRDLVGRLTQALGVLVISLGFVNLNIALGRPTHVAHAPPA